MSIRATLETTLLGMGYELVEFELGANGSMRIFMDKEGGVTVDDCVAVSNHLTRLFAVENIDYNRLEVSSPGLDRPLKTPADFIRFMGKLAKIKVRLPIDNQKRFLGRIEAFESSALTLNVEGRSVIIEFGNIDKARLEPEF